MFEGGGGKERLRHFKAAEGVGGVGWGWGGGQQLSLAQPMVLLYKMD